MAKKNQKRKTYRFVSASGAAYYLDLRVDDDKTKEINKYDKNTRKVEVFRKHKGNLGRNEIKKRKN